MRGDHDNPSPARDTAACALVAALLLPGDPAFGQQDGPELDEIVVTARKRDELLQKTPVSVTAFTRADLEARKLQNLSQLARFTPNVEFDFTAPRSGSTNSAVVFIRGVGQTDYVPNKDPGVGIYLDGGYITRPVGSVLNLLDVERVEILRGPQGTLFGKNTVGGAINVITVEPGDEFGMEMDVTVGSYDRADIRASMDTPLADSVSARWSIGYFSRDGYMERISAGDRAGNDREIAGRLSIRWEPAKRFNADLSLDYSEADEQGTASKLLSTDIRVPVSPYSIGDPETFFAGQAYNVLIGATDTGASMIFPFLPPLPADTSPYDRRWLTDDIYTTNATGPNYSEHSVFGAAATLSWGLPLMTVKSITAYRTTEANFGRDPDGSPLIISHSEIWVDYEQTSQELQLLGRAFDRRLDWLGGLYFITETGRQRDLVPFVDETFRIYEMLDIDIPNFLAVNGPFSENSIDSFAAFGELTYAATNKLELTAGLRWTSEDRETIGNTTQGGFPTVTNPGAGLDIEETTGRFILKYAWNDALMAYASYSEGFKSGGFNHRLGAPDPTNPLDAPTEFAPEYVTTYEFGLKASPGSARTRISASVFHSDYRDIQVVVSDAGVPRTINAARGGIDGLEFELDTILTETWRVDLAYGYLDARYTRLDENVPGAFGSPVDMPLALDTRFVNSPEHSLALGAEVGFTLANGPDLHFRTDVTYSSDVANDAINTPEVTQGDLWLLSANLTIVPDRCGCEISIFGENLTDQQYIVSGGGASAESGFAEAIMARPREWGLRVGYRFD